MTCDLAEVYHITDADALQPSLLATLVYGLPDDSRLMRALSGRRYSSIEILIAAALDRLSTLIWFQTKDGLKGRNRPKSIVESMTREEKHEKTYSVPVDEIEDALKRIREG